MSFVLRLRRIFSIHFLLFLFLSTSLFLQLSIKSANAFPADFDGDSKNDLVVFRPSGVDQGKWFVIPSSGTCPKKMCTPNTAPCAPYYYGGCYFQWGLNNDRPLSGDYDVDGKADFTVFRQSNLTWYIFYSSGSSVTVSFAGTGADLVDESDINGDGRSEMILMTNPYVNNKADLHVRTYTPSQGIILTSWLNLTLAEPGVEIDAVTLQSANYLPFSPNPEPAYTYFTPHDSHPPFDFSESWFALDTDTIGQRVNIFERLNTLGNNPFPIAKRGNFGGAMPNLSDYTIWAPTTGIWKTAFNGGGTGSPVSTQWGLNGDVPLTGNYDSDQIADYVVWRPSDGTWYLKPSSGTCPKTFCTPSTAPCAPYYYGGCKKQWGLAGDIPVD